MSEYKVSEGWVGLAVSLGVVLVMVGIGACATFIDDASASQKCQALGYSAGHYEKESGLVCEQWIPAAKVEPR